MNRTLQNTKKQNAESKGDQIQTAIQQIEKIEERLIEKEKDRPCYRRDFERVSEATTHTNKTKMFFFFLSFWKEKGRSSIYGTRDELWAVGFFYFYFVGTTYREERVMRSSFFIFPIYLGLLFLAGSSQLLPVFQSFPFSSPSCLLYFTPPLFSLLTNLTCT
jgi:hypothetical protein